jgi:hypothetical protein
MAGLTEHQTELISAYIRQKGVAQDALHDDLLDHICTGIENRMQQGDSFEDAFSYIITLFGPGGVKQVQQDTFELLTEIHGTMKKVTLGFGLTSTFFLLAGTFFKLMHWPGASIMIVLGAALLVLGYYPLLLYYKLREAPGNESLLHLSGYLGMTLTTVGVLFKIMHWPSANILLWSGLGAIAFVYIPVYFYNKYKSSVNKPVTLSAALVAITSMILLFALTRTNNTPYMLDGIALIEEQLRETTASGGENSLLYQRLQANEDAASVRESAEQARIFLQGMRTKVVAVTEGISETDARNIPMMEMRFFEARKPATEMLFSSASDPEFRYTELERHLSAFRNAVLSIYPAPIRDEVAAFFPVKAEGSYRVNDRELGWAQYYFEGVPAFTVISLITKLENDIRQAENQALLYLLSQPAVSGTPG